LEKIMATKRKSVTPSKTKADAIGLLTSDHGEVRQMFDAYQDLVDAQAEDEEKQALAERICRSLTVHATLEEEIFYPAARAALEEQELLDEAEVEHASIESLIAQIQDMEVGDELFDAKVKVLGEYVNHHVQEEEGEMFPKVRESELDLDVLGDELLNRKQELVAETDVESAA